jgi:hypothetical protein
VRFSVAKYCSSCPLLVNLAVRVAIGHGQLTVHVLCSAQDQLEVLEPSIEATMRVQACVHRWEPGITFGEFAARTFDAFYES